MTVVGSPEQQTLPPELNLYEELAQLEVPFLNRVETLATWHNLCPLPADDPRMTVEAMNQFVVKMVNQAGMEIEPKYEHIFNHITEERGLERGYTVTPPVDAVKVDHPEAPVALPVSVEQTIVLVEPMDEVIWHRQAELLQAVALLGEVTAVPTEGVEAPMPVVIETEFAPKPTAKPQEPLPPLVAIANIYPEPARQTDNGQAVEVAQAPLQAAEANDLPPFTRTSEAITEVKKPLTLLELPQLVSESAPSDWIPELHQAPKTILQDFTEAITVLAGLTEVMLTDVEAEEPTLPIIPLVSHRLAELDPQEHIEAAEIVKDIIGALHGLEIVTAQGGDPELVMEMQAQLTELCIRLFEALHIDYTEQDVQDFLQVLASTQLRQLMLSPADLEKMGTHEVKYFNDAMGATTGQPLTLHSLLGMMALLPSRKALMVS